MNQTNPIKATVKAVMAATGFMACRIEVVAKKVPTVIIDAKTRKVPNAKLL